MRNFERILTALGLVALLATGACSSSTGEDADGTSTGDVGADASSGNDTTADTGSDTGNTMVTYKFVAIDGSPYAEPDCAATSSPGPDIDAIALYRNNQLMGVAKPGTAVFKAGLNPACAEKKDHSTTSDVEGPLNADESKGYFGVSNGTVEFQFGACSTATQDVKACDGKGATIDVQEGDEIDIYEVDSTYQTKSACESNANTKDKSKCGLGPEAGQITAACKCLAEEYEVYAESAAGSATVSLGKYSGTSAGIKVIK